MFKDDYKKANDNIKIDDALLEKTLNEAFSVKPKKKYYYRPVSSIAAALIIVVGAGIAYPELVKTPQTESTAIVPQPKPVVTIAPVGEKITAKETKPDEIVTPKPKKVVSKPKKENIKTDEFSDIDSVVQVYDEFNNLDIALPNEDLAEVPVIASSVTQPEISEPDESAAAFSRVRTMSGPDESSVVQDENSSEFVLESCTDTDANKVYIYKNSQDKSFTVIVEPVTEEALNEVVPNRVISDGKLYTLYSDNMTDEELASAFESLEF